jgi:uncharacterized phage-associated protein
MKNNQEAKLKELIVYISSKCSNDIKYGKTKLNKILYYSDFLFYSKKQKSITDSVYRHLPHGPVPDDMDKLLKNMQNKDIAFAVTNAGPYTQTKIVALREPNLSLFDAEMIAHVDSVIDTVCNKNSLSASRLSEMTHQTIGWIVTSNGQEIPYQTIFIKDKKYQIATASERIKARELAIKFAGQYGFPSNHTYDRSSASM